ncbi:MAG: hypothetical protein M3380_10320 [Chloroflexota bacterium]|nr:hypothetical protein [Chloroflexota bacterium]
MGQPEVGQLPAQPQQHHAGTGRRRRALQGKGVDDLGRGGRILRVDAVEEGQHVGKEGVRLVERKPGMKAVEGAVVGRGAEQRQADIPATDEVAGEELFKGRIGTGAGPDPDDLGPHEQADGIGGLGAGTGGVVVSRTGVHDGLGVVDLGEADERVRGAAGQHSAIELGGEPGEKGLQPVGEQGEDDGRDGGQRGRIGGRQLW